MNWMALIIILIVVFAMWQGFRTGFVQSTINLVIWAGSLFLAFLTYTGLGNALTNFIPALTVWALPLAFLLAMFFFRFLLSFFAGLLLEHAPLYLKGNKLNKALGLVPGLINGLIYVYFLVGLVIAFPDKNVFAHNSPGLDLADRFRPGIQWFTGKVGPIFNNVIQKSFGAKTVEPEKNETINLHFHVMHPNSRADLEIGMLELVNQARKEKGLRPLVRDTALVAVGRYHAKDMFARGYFSHYTPEGSDPFERMKAFGINFTSAGENLALGQTLTICHEGLMNSPGHRANILNPSFGRVGIGILDGGIYGLMITQEFRN